MLLFLLFFIVSMWFLGIVIKLKFFVGLGNGLSVMVCVWFKICLE